MVAISDTPAADPSIALSCFGIAMPSQPASPPNFVHSPSIFLSHTTSPSLAFSSSITKGIFGASNRASIFANLPVTQGMKKINFSPSHPPPAFPPYQTSQYWPPPPPQQQQQPQYSPPPPPPCMPCAAAAPPSFKSEGCLRPEIFSEFHALADSLVALNLGRMEACLAFAEVLHNNGVVCIDDLSCFEKADLRNLLTQAGMSKIQQVNVMAAVTDASAPAPPPMSGASPPPALAAADRAPTNAVGGSSLLDVLGALHGACWSMRHPAVALFLAKQLPQATSMCKSNAHVTVAVIVVLRARFKDSKNGWVAHVKRAALHARSALGDIEYTAHKAALASAMS